MEKNIIQHKKTKQINKIIDYIGSKEKLFNFIEEKMNITKKQTKVIDLFSGSCVFSKMLYDKHYKKNIQLITNDYQYFSYIASNFIDGYIEKEKLIKLIKILDNLEPISGDIFNEFSENGNPRSINDKEKVFNFIVAKTNKLEPQYRNFFKEEVGKKADAIKNQIKKWNISEEITEEETNILLLFLLYFVDKNANTTSVYGAYLKEQKMKNIIPFYNETLIEALSNNQKTVKVNDRQNLGVLEFLEKYKHENKKVDIIYIDPPYNTRDYFSLYHILNYIVDLNFHPISDIRINSKTAIPNKENKNLFSTSTTENTMNKIIGISSEISDKIYLSYNNESFLTLDQFEKIFQQYGLKYKLHTQEHQRYISRTDRESHTKIQEWLFEIFK
jgi:adenine-specific DNA-methyltransferase